MKIEKGRVVLPELPPLEEARWRQVVQAPTLERAAQRAYSVWLNTPPDLREAVQSLVLKVEQWGKPKVPPNVRDLLMKFDGEPVAFSIFLFLCMPTGEKTCLATFNHIYHSLTGKKMDGYGVHAAAWVTGRYLQRRKGPLKKPVFKRVRRKDPSSKPPPKDDTLRVTLNALLDLGSEAKYSEVLDAGYEVVVPPGTTLEELIKAGFLLRKG